MPGCDCVWSVSAFTLSETFGCSVPSPKARQTTKETPSPFPYSSCYFSTSVDFFTATNTLEVCVKLQLYFLSANQIRRHEQTQRVNIHSFYSTFHVVHGKFMESSLWMPSQILSWFILVSSVAERISFLQAWLLFKNIIAEQTHHRNFAVITLGCHWYGWIMSMLCLSVLLRFSTSICSESLCLGCTVFTLKNSTQNSVQLLLASSWSREGERERVFDDSRLSPNFWFQTHVPVAELEKGNTHTHTYPTHTPYIFDDGPDFSFQTRDAAAERAAAARGEAAQVPAAAGGDGARGRPQRPQGACLTPGVSSPSHLRSFGDERPVMECLKLMAHSHRASTPTLGVHTPILFPMFNTGKVILMAMLTLAKIETCSILSQETLLLRWRWHLVWMGLSS